MISAKSACLESIRGRLYVTDFKSARTVPIDFWSVFVDQIKGVAVHVGEVYGYGVRVKVSVSE